MNRNSIILICIITLIVIVSYEPIKDMIDTFCSSCNKGFISNESQVFFTILSHHHEKYVFIIPDFTISAYQKNGFYDYYRNNQTNSSITVKVITESYYQKDPIIQELKQYGFSTVTDTQVTLHPSILKNYTKVILLHNEYVTQQEFDTIQAHPNVLYLYVNTLYAQVSYDNGTITLIKGHGYPKAWNPITHEWKQGDMRNAFGWKYDMNRFFELNQNCGYEFKKIPNGYESPCFPRSLQDFNQVNIWKNILN